MSRRCLLSSLAVLALGATAPLALGDKPGDTIVTLKPGDRAPDVELTDTGTGLLSRLNADYFLLDSGSGQTVFNDSSTDTETGSAGSDWFFAGTADKVTDLSASDQAFIFGP